MTLFFTPAAVVSGGDNLLKMLESIWSPPTRIVIESGEEEGGSSMGYLGESWGEEEESSSGMEVEELLSSESPKSLICAVSLLERGTLIKRGLLERKEMDILREGLRTRKLLLSRCTEWIILFSGVVLKAHIRPGEAHTRDGCDHW